MPVLERTVTERLAFGALRYTRALNEREVGHIHNQRTMSLAAFSAAGKTLGCFMEFLSIQFNF
jgi:hypothetical protein